MRRKIKRKAAGLGSGKPGMGSRFFYVMGMVRPVGDVSVKSFPDDPSAGTAI